MIKTSNARYSHTGGHEFKGHTLIGTKVFESGAIRVTVNFDESFRACTVDVVYGTDGNMFGGNSE